VQIADLVEQDLLEASLRAARHVVMKRAQLGARRPRRSTQPLGQRLGEHAGAGEEIEAHGIEREASTGPIAHDRAHGSEQVGRAVGASPMTLYSSVFTRKPRYAVMAA